MLKALVESSVMLGALVVSATATAGEPGHEMSPGYEEGLPILRFQRDAGRDRGGLLTASGVFVFTLSTRQAVAHVSLPRWSALVLDRDADKDVGFTGLTFSQAQGALYAVSDHGALWHIDLRLRRAQKVDLSTPMPRACGIATRPRKNGVTRFFGLCVRGQQGGWTVHLAPDRRSGYVIARPCTP